MSKNFKYITLIIAAAALALSSCSRSADSAQSIFNGRDLSGWEGDPGFWSVRDGAITGCTTPEKPAEQNTFLIWKDGRPANFELRLSFRLSAQNDEEFSNSGIQYRSRLVDPERFVVGGYQADLDLNGRYAGMLYEERGRGLIMRPGEKIRLLPAEPDSDKKTKVEKLETLTDPAAIRAAYKVGEWNELLIVAEGDRLRHFLNGAPTAEVIDDDPARAQASGVLALQLHRGEPMTAQFKNLQLKTLP